MITVTLDQARILAMKIASDNGSIEVSVDGGGDSIRIQQAGKPAIIIEQNEEYALVEAIRLIGASCRSRIKP